LNCTNCGTLNPAGRRFCDNCGNSLASPCPNCGEQNRPDARFCGSCGTALAGRDAPTSEPPNGVPAAQAPSTVAERRLVSVLFADLVGFTPFAEERDAEHVRETLTRYFDTARTVIERHGGTVEKFIGDAVMAVWGTPVAHEDDAERAVRAALELIPAVKTVDAALEARVGVLTGEAAVSLGAVDQGMVAGDLVNTAARLQSVAQAGAVLVGESTMRAAGAAIVFTPVGEQELKGKTAPVPAWRAVRVVGGREREGSDGLEPPFVGREAELALLKELIHAAGQEKRPRLIAISGPAGIGKSRLAAEFATYLDGLVESIYWHRGRSPSYGEGTTFWARGEMVRRRARLAEDDDEAMTRQRIADTLADFVPDEQDRRLVEPALLALLGVGEPPPGGRDVLFAAWRIFFERIAARGTTVLLFEDLQWADSGLLDFIDHLLEWSKGVPLVVLALARPELTERRPEFGSATRHFHSIPLEPLPEAHMRELLAGLVPGLPENAVEAIVGRADGIPLYAVETVRMLLADKRLEPVGDGTYRPTGPLDQLAIPETLRSLVAARLDALDPTDKALLQQAAVLGQTFSLDSLATVSGQAADEISQRLRRLVRREILSVEADPRSPERGQYAFVQGVIREVAYGTLSRRERRERHLAAARHYEAVGDEELAGALASHYLAAVHASDDGAERDAVAAQARLALRGAAERATALASYAQALTYLEQALEVTDEAADRAQLLESAALAAQADARNERAIELARQASAAYRAVNEMAGAWRAEGALGMIMIDAGQLNDAVEVLTAALAELPEDTHELHAELDARLSRAYMRLSRFHEAVAAADRALAVAEVRRMTAVVAEAMNNKGSALAGLGRWREAAALLEAAAAIAHEAGEMELHVRALNNLAVVIDDEDPMRGMAIVEAVLAVARRHGLRRMATWLAGAPVFYQLRIGRDWDAPLADLQEAIREGGGPAEVPVTMRQPEIIARAFRGEGTDGDVADLEEAAQRRDDPSARSFTIAAQGTLALNRGDVEAAHDLFATAIEVRPDNVLAIVGGVRSALWLGDAGRFRAVSQRLAEVPSSGRAVEAVRIWARAGLAALEGRHDEARSGLLEAISRKRELQSDFLAASMALDAVILLPADPQIREQAEWAREVFSRVGARPFLARLEHALAADATPTAPASPR
jgi:class 3 adenylate cyclase/predicted ATPase